MSDELPGSFDLVIFDCDGVLVDSEPIANRVLSERLAAIGLPMTVEETLRTFMGRTLPACLEIIERRLGAFAPPGFLDDLQRRTFEAFRHELEPVPGVRELLDDLPLPCCVASSGDLLKMRTTLALTGLGVRFEGRMFSASEVEQGKPAPDLFLLAARRMGADPRRCAVVEDTALGVLAGVAAGMTVFGFAARTDAAELAGAGARATFASMGELPALLGLAPGQSGEKESLTPS